MKTQSKFKQKSIPNLEVPNRVFLAPMEEVNDVAFRLLCKQAGCGLTYTGMIHPLNQKEIELEGKPALQLFTTDTKGIAEFMKKYDSKVSLWDFNLGCPAKNARKRGFGSFMTHELGTIEQILKTMRENTKKPLTVKLRKSKNTFKILKLAKKYCDAVCIHPRTQNQGYSGIADINYALEFKKKSKLPVIYSGDVTEYNANELLKQFDYVMIGRRAIGNPNIFNNFSDKRTKFNFQDYLQLAKKYKFPYKQIKFQAVNFTKGMDNATGLRGKLTKIKSVNELKKFASINFKNN